MTHVLVVIVISTRCNERLIELTTLKAWRSWFLIVHGSSHNGEPSS